MAVKIRMTRMGRRHRPFFRINAVDGRTPRDGRILEKLGHYDPLEKDVDKQVVLDLEKVQAWLDKGAQPSETVAEILLKLGVKTKQYEAKQVRKAKALAQARKDGKLFNKADRVAAVKAVEAKAEAEKAKAQAEADEAKAKAEAEKAKAEEEKAQAEADEAKAAEEAAKAEEAKAAETAPKVEETKTEEPKVEEAKTEEPATEAAPETEEPKTE
jgi:small subunit ribosomal protein S16